MIKRIRIFYNTKTGNIKGSKLSIKDWVRYKIHENLDSLEYKDDFSAIYARDRENGVFVVYAHTHRDAQKAMRKFFKNPLIQENGYEQV
jgi:hypothetical protein